MRKKNNSQVLASPSEQMVMLFMVLTNRAGMIGEA